jgi:molecular chaperone DnaJ
MERPKDYYGLLGVPRDASTAAITRAYRKRVRQLEPAHRSGATAEDLHALQRAYETLRDAERRRRYDEALAQPQGVPERSHGESLPLRPATGLRRPMRAETLAADVVLSATEALRGGVLPLDLPVSAECSSCEGTGGAAFDCAPCSGEGRIGMRLPMPVRIPPGIRSGTVFDLRVDETTVRSLLLTVHVGGPGR